MSEEKREMGKVFEYGSIVTTAAVHDIYTADRRFARFVAMSLGRHLSGDWGDLDKEDKALNEEALKSGGRLHSAYKIPESFKTEDKLWIITEADRSVTTILFPSDY